MTRKRRYVWFKLRTELTALEEQWRREDQVSLSFLERLERETEWDLARHPERQPWVQAVGAG